MALKKNTADKPLTLQEELFVKAYLSNGRKQTEAAITAGYSEKSAKVQASDLIHRPRIIKRIKELDKKLVKRIKGSADWKKRKLLQVMEFLITVDGGQITSMKDAKAFLAAMAEHNKMEGHYSAEKVVNHNYNADTDLETLKKETARQEDILAKHRKEY